MLDKPLRRTVGEQWGWLDRPRTATWWHPLQHPQWPACRQVLAERPRRRQLQLLLHEIIGVFSIPDPRRYPPLQPAMAA
jgi:hypothetical protein